MKASVRGFCFSKPQFRSWFQFEGDVPDHMLPISTSSTMTLLNPWNVVLNYSFTPCIGRLLHPQAVYSPCSDTQLKPVDKHVQKERHMEKPVGMFLKFFISNVPKTNIYTACSWTGTFDMSVHQSKLCCRFYLVSGKVVDYAGQRRFSSHGHSHVADWFAKLGHICKITWVKR